MKNLDTAVILAGGKSSRLSFDKQTIKVGDKLIAHYIGDLLSKEFKEIFINSNKPNLYDYGCPYEVLTDILPGMGPKSGLLTGLQNSKESFVYFTGCDMPFVNVKYIQYMKQLISEADEKIMAVLAHRNGFYEPLNAYYSKALIPEIISQLDNGDNKISSLYSNDNTILIEDSELELIDPEDLMFLNLNTQKDFEGLNEKNISL